jgi:hypothetical protein
MNRLAAALVLVVIVAAARPAAAAPDPFKTFLSDLVSNPKGAAAYLKDCDLALLPDGEARTPCTIALADLVGAQAGVTFTAKNVKDSEIPQSTIEYLDADVDAKAGGKTIASFHVVEVGSSFNEAALFVPYDVHWARVMSDKDATAKAKAKQLAAPPAIKDVVVPMPKGTDEQEQQDRDEGVRELKQVLSQDDLKGVLAGITDGGAVFGSARGQRYAGKRAGKQIASWKLGLAQKGGITATGNSLVVAATTDVVGTLPDKTTITYAALVVASMHMIPESGDHVWDVKVVSFAVPQ